MPREVDSDICERVLRRRREGHLQKDIAKEVGVYQSTVSDICRAEGLEAKSPKFDLAKLLRLRRAGFLQSEIAKILDISQPTVSIACREAGLGEIQKKNHKHYPPSVQKQALQLYEFGYSCDRVGELLGPHSKTIWTWVVAAGKARSPREAAKARRKLKKAEAERKRLAELLRKKDVEGGDEE